MRLTAASYGMILALAISVAAVISACDEGPQPEKQADPLSLGVTLDGDTVSTGEFRGKVVLLLFWATWCTLCEPAFADLDTLWATLSPSGPFALVALDFDFIEGALETYLQNQYHEFQITTHVPMATVNAFGLSGIPKYVVLDTNGYTQWHKLGYQPPESIEAVVAKELEKLAL